MQQGSQNLESSLDQAHLHYMRGELEEARHIAETVLADQPGDQAAQRLLASVVLKQTDRSTRRLQLRKRFADWELRRSSVNGYVFVGLLWLGFGLWMALWYYREYFSTIGFSLRQGKAYLF